MHGVKRVPEGERDHAKEALKKEKAAKFRKLAAEIIRRRRAKIYDEESMGLTTKILEVNPEFYTAWNLRRLIIDSSLSSGNSEEATGALKRELALLQASIQHNAKIYCLWHHRSWVVHQLVLLGDESVLASELALCDQLLKLDERNFHCWAYRLSISKKAGHGPREGLEFTREKIDRNFSNYSAWHYRSSFMEQHALKGEDIGGGGGEGGGGGGRECLLEALELEAELVQGAVFTDPEDQSAWLYLRWIIEKQAPATLRVTAAKLPKGDGGEGIGGIALSFSQAVVGVGGVGVLVEGAEQGGGWKAVSSREKRHEFAPPPCSESWVFEGACGSGACVSVSIKGVKTAAGRLADACTLELGEGEWVKECFVATSQGGEGGEGGGEGAVERERGRWSDSLSKHLSLCEELLEIEPDCKWAMLTRCMLLSLKLRSGGEVTGSEEEGGGSVKGGLEMTSLIDRLVSVDPARRNYYSHMGSNVQLSGAINAWSEKPDRTVSLSNIKLTHIDTSLFSRLVGITSLDLSSNSLSSCQAVSLLPVLIHLSLARNRISTIWPLSSSLSLRSLDLSHNEIRSLPDLEPLLNLKGLLELGIAGNPFSVAKQEEARELLSKALQKALITL